MQILQDQLIKLQNGRDKANSIALQNQATRADQAEKKAVRLQEKLDAVLRTKTQEVQDLEKQNADLQKKLSEYNKTLQERLKADFEVLSVKKNEDKLYQELRTHKGTITDLKQEISELEDKRDNIMAELSNLKASVMSSVTALQSVTSELTQAAKVEVVSPAKRKALESKKAAALPSAQKEKQGDDESGHTAIETKLARQQEALRADIREKIRKKQHKREEDVTAAKEKKGLFQRIASFF